MKSDPGFPAGEKKTRRKGNKAFLPTSSSLTIDIRAAVLNLSVTVKSLENTWPLALTTNHPAPQTPQTVSGVSGLFRARSLCGRSIPAQGHVLTSLLLAMNAALSLLTVQPLGCISQNSVVTGHRNQLWLTEAEKQFIGWLLGSS